MSESIEQAWRLQREEEALTHPGEPFLIVAKGFVTGEQARGCELTPGHKRNLLSNSLNQRGRLRSVALAFKVQDVDPAGSTHRTSRSARPCLSSRVLPKPPGSFYLSLCLTRVEPSSHLG